MAMFHIGGIRSVCWAFLSVSVLLLPACCEEFPTLALVKSWGDAISVDLLNKLNSSTRIDSLRQKYEEKNFSTSKIDGQALVKEVSDKWQQMLAKKMVAVKNIVDVLEEAFANHTHNDSIQAQDVHFPNAKTFQGTLELTYLENFGTYVNTDKSAVQIPTDIWEGDKTILNGIEATHPIDKAFRDNYAKDPQLLWQYFGSADGFYRSFPAAAWVAEDPSKDQYDVRRRGWYIQAASSPKNIMILIDTSGSTYGLTSEIIKVSVSKSLDTLGNDDFVNVAYFSSDVDHVSCFRGFVQANLRNKEKLKEAVQNLESAGIANFHKALEFAFDEFTNFKDDNELNQGAKCHQAILIFTDGGEDTEKDVFNTHNNPITTRVFVYNVGSDSMVSPAGVKSMACNNKGFFSNIKSFGAVRLTTLDYVPVLSRPMVLSEKKHFQWSDIYLDALGLGMMTTLTRPVYNKTKPRPGEPENQQMLGVVGTDITTKNMEETVPKNKIGPEGYAFGINSNGYILLHPRLKAEEEIEAMLGKPPKIPRSRGRGLGYLSEPPNVDFLEVEFVTEEKKALRKNMIDTKTDQQVLRTPVMSEDERYVEFVNMTYSYTNIENTTFSVAIAQPSFGLYEFNIDSAEVDYPTELGLFKGGNNEDDFVLIAPWEFCSGIQENNATTEDITSKLQKDISQAQQLKEDELGTSENVTQNMTADDAVVTMNVTDDDNATCDNSMVKKLFIDARITKELLEEWKSQPANTNSGIVYQMVATQGGLTRIHPAAVPEKWTEDEVEAFQDPWDQAYYQRALYTNDYVFSVPYNTGKKLGVNETFLSEITASKALKMEGTKEITPAVLAVVFDPKSFNQMWIGHTTKGFNGQEVKLSCEDENLHCYILDDGGFMIATNQKEHQDNVGKFFGLIDSNIMHDLHNKSFYERIETIDYQAACPRHSPIGDAAPRSINIPTVADIFNFNYWAITAAWTFLRHTLYDMFIFGVTDYSMVGAETVEVPENVSCIKLQKQYYFGANASLGARGSVACMNCSREWASTKIEGTNLVLVVTRRGGCNGCPERTLTQVAEEPSQDKVPNPCNMTPPYRRRPSNHCYAFNDNESKICSGCSFNIPPLTHLVWQFIFYILIVVSLTNNV